jgi:hypothetical protein
MNSIYNTDTGEIVELTEPFADEDWVDSLHDDPRVSFDAIEGRFEADSKTVEWWLSWRNGHRHAESFIRGAMEQLDEANERLLRDKLEQASFGEIRDQPLRRVIATIEFMATRCLFWEDGSWKSGGSSGEAGLRGSSS